MPHPSFKSPFTGFCAFPLTPAAEDGRIDTDALQQLLARIVEGKASSIGLLGSTGSYMYLTRNERRRAVEAAVEGVAGRLPIIAGIGALRTDEACALACDAASAGADALLLAPVSYTPLTGEEVFRHYTAVAAASDLPLCIYNNPTTPRFVFDDDLLGRLAGLRNITAVQMPLPGAGDIPGELYRLRNGGPE